jgi:hypothetical protein
MPENQPKKTTDAFGLSAKPPSTVVPSRELLDLYAEIHPNLAFDVMDAWNQSHRRAFWYAFVSTLIGGLIALSLVGGFIYLMMNGHSKAAGILLGAGALGMVAGFRSTRLN